MVRYPWSPSPNFVYKSMYPLVSTLLLEKATICSSIGTIVSLAKHNRFNVFQYRMSTELPWSTNVFSTTKFATSMVITIGSSYSRSMPWKSFTVNVMLAILRRLRQLIMLTLWITLKCLLRVNYVVLPPPNPLDMVLIMAQARAPWCLGASFSRSFRPHSAFSFQTSVSWVSLPRDFVSRSAIRAWLALLMLCNIVL